jgi:hypothetical protein
VTRLAPDWRNYCIYSGRHLPDAALSDEHVIPVSLGGSRSTMIRTSRHLNSTLGTTIDARIVHDSMVQFGRRDADARGQARSRLLASPTLARGLRTGFGDSGTLVTRLRFRRMGAAGV